MNSPQKWNNIFRSLNIIGISKIDGQIDVSYCLLSLKCKISAIWLVETACIFLIFLIATMQISMDVKRKGTRQDIQNIWTYTNLKHTWYMCKYRIKQGLIVLKLNSASINKILVTKFLTLKVSQNLNLMQSLSTQCFQGKSNVWNKTFENKLIEKDHRIPDK